MFSWKEISSSQKCHDSIILGILRTSLQSYDHMMTIYNGLIFGGNLSYAITLNLEKLNWCAGYGKQEVFFNKFKLDTKNKIKSQKKKKQFVIIKVCVKINIVFNVTFHII